MNISDIFRTQKAAAPAPAANPAAASNTVQGKPAPQPSPGGGMPANAPNPGADIEGAVTNLNQQATTQTKNDNPLDNFKDIFTISDDDKKNAPPDPFGEPLLTFDPKKFGEAANKMNFAAGVPQEMIAKALGGDAPTFTAILNKVSQAAFTASAQVFTGILEQSVKKNNGRWDQALSSRFRDMQIDYTRPTNPALQHPAAQPLLTALKTTIAGNPKNANLRPEEINAKAEEYFTVLADSIAGAKSQNQDAGKGTPAEIDWTKFLGS